MVTYAVGDIQGCSATLQRLLDRLRGAGFDERADTLWLAGDLVNRGPGSLAVLRWAVEQERRMGPRLVVVLGNHDLHLLGVAAGVERVRKGDTFGDVLAAPARERDELVGDDVRGVGSCEPEHRLAHRSQAVGAREQLRDDLRVHRRPAARHAPDRLD
ncbi:MAG TPA: metallophosphoesterase, partial [Planctomycetota bacterium]|nr:metallophosphoesterase [Planctomycetota bacterium]